MGGSGIVALTGERDPDMALEGLLISVAAAIESNILSSSRAEQDAVLFPSYNLSI